MQSILFHYTAVITPVLFIAAIYGYLYINKKLGIPYKSIAIVQLIITMLFSYYMSPLLYSKQYDGRTFTEHKLETQDVTIWAHKLANENIAVSASLGVAPKFTDRKVMIPFSSKYSKAEYVVLLKQEVLNDWFDSPGSKVAYNTLVHDKHFARIYAQNDLEVYKKDL